MTERRTMFDSLIYHALGRWRARDLDPDRFHDLVDLWDMRVVLVTGRGKSITQMHVDVRSLWRAPLKIVIPRGTAFSARGGHQNMATRREYVLDIEPGATRFVQVDVCCIDGERPVPGTADAFRGARRTKEALTRFLEASDGHPPMTVQAGVWALSDGYGREQIKRRLITLSGAGRASRGISDADVDGAARILDRLDIPSPLSIR